MSRKNNEKSQSDMSDENVTLDLSRMSLKDKARLAALIETDGDSDLRQHILGAIGRSQTARGSLKSSRPVVPERWSPVYVLDRMVEAFRTLASQPVGGKARSSSVWPIMEQQPLTFKDLIEMQGTGELEQREADQNRVRLAPTSQQVSQMEQALAWPFQHLSDKPELARAILLRAEWEAKGADIRKQCGRRGIDHGGFNRDWQEAIMTICGMLISQKVPVS